MAQTFSLVSLTASMAAAAKDLMSPDFDNAAGSAKGCADADSAADFSGCSDTESTVASAAKATNSCDFDDEETTRSSGWSGAGTAEQPQIACTQVSAVAAAAVADVVAWLSEAEDEDDSGDMELAMRELLEVRGIDNFQKASASMELVGVAARLLVERAGPGGSARDVLAYVETEVSGVVDNLVALALELGIRRPKTRWQPSRQCLVSQSRLERRWEPRGRGCTGQLGRILPSRDRRVVARPRGAGPATGHGGPRLGCLRRGCRGQSCLQHGRSCVGDLCGVAVSG